MLVEASRISPETTRGRGRRCWRAVRFPPPFFSGAPTLTRSIAPESTVQQRCINLLLTKPSLYFLARFDARLSSPPSPSLFTATRDTLLAFAAFKPAARAAASFSPPAASASRRRRDSFS